MKHFKKHKFHAIRTETDGIKFPSKKEARYYTNLKILQQSGEIVGFFRQVPLDLPGGITYKMDFLVYHSDGTWEAIEVKGYETSEWKLKYKLVKEAYPWLNLKIVK